MELLKKIVVVIFGLGIIGAVVFVLIQSSQPIAEQTPIVKEAVPEPSAALPSGEDSSSIQPEPEGFESMQRSHPSPGETPQPPASSDTIHWKQGSDSNIKLHTNELSRKSPFADDPNFIFTRAAQRILPAVVFIRSSRRVQRPPFQFHRFLWPDEEEPPPDEENSEEDKMDYFQPGTGSGIIASPDGYIMTNYHVVEEAELIRVTLYDKRTYTARFVGGDPTTDIALLKIEEQNLPAAYIGDSDSIMIGEWVIAVGNPLNFASTVTTGIVSALGRDIRIIDEEYRIENFIQTDAVINPGNSGGALVNLRGEVIGMNTAIATRNGYYQGYGFAIPINLVKKVVTDILKYGKVKRALLGVSIEPVTDRVARALKLPRPYGALVQGVHKGYPAEDAGFQQGDIILKVNGEEVASVNDLQIKIAQHHPGDKVELTVWRDGKEWLVTLELGEAPGYQVPETKTYHPENLEFKNLGLTIRDLESEDRVRFEVEKGVFIEKVASGSPADDAGVFPTSVLLSVNGTEVSSVSHFEELLQAANPGDVLVLKLKSPGIEFGDGTRLVFVEVPEKIQ